MDKSGIDESTGGGISPAGVIVGKICRRLEGLMVVKNSDTFYDKGGVAGKRFNHLMGFWN